MDASALPTRLPAHILIVDDEQHNRDLLTVLLAQEGYVLATATSGAEALASIYCDAPDLVLLDVMMPDIDGYEVARRIKGNSATRNVPVIMVTARDDQESRLLGLDAGAEDFLTHPVSPAELVARVRNLLRLKTYGDYHDRYSQMLEAEVCLRSADLVESERMYRQAFDASPVGIVHVALDGTWLRVNQRLCDLLGYAREELVGVDIHKLLQLDETPGDAEAFRQMAAGTLDRHVIDERHYRRRDGGVLWARLTTSVHRDADNQPLHLISVAEDITDQRTLEAQVRQAAKMDAIGRLASGVAHDFNNLLTVILASAELLSANTSSAAESAADLGEIIKAAHRAARLTNQLLAFSRQQVLHAAPLDVNGLIADMTGMLERLIGADVKVVLALASTPLTVLADRGQLEQVVMNLVVNARDAMPKGGRITIETAELALDGTSHAGEPIVPGPYVVVAVTDTGTGMTSEVRQRLFDPFFTTKEIGKGTGLGLATAYGIVKQTRGYIWVSSEIGVGSTFTVVLPRSSATVPAAVASVTVDAPTVQRASETVLLVDHEPGVRTVSRRILGSAGYRVLEAGNAADAEALFSQHPGAIDLVVTDAIIPGGGGSELLTRLRRRAPAVRVLFMSGDSARATPPFTTIGADIPCMRKPFTAAELVRQVRGALDREITPAGVAPLAQ